MDSVRRVVIHDKYPVFEPEILFRPINRVVLAVAGVSLCVQVAAAVQVVKGAGQQPGLFEHAAFATVSLIWLALGILVFLQRRAGSAGRFFLLSAASGSVFLSLGTLYGAVSLFDSFLYAAGVLLFPAFLFCFARAFQGEPRTRRDRLEWLLFIPPALLVWTGAQDLYHAQATPLWRTAIALIGCYLGASVVQAVFNLREARNPAQAAQARALLFGLAAGITPAIVIIIAPLTLTGHFAASISWMAPLVLLFLLAMSYAVLLFEFTEADLIVRRGVVYGAITLAIVVAYGALGVALTAGGSSVQNPGGGLSFVAVTVLIGALFAPLAKQARRLVDWLFYGGRTDRWELLQALSARLATIMQPEELSQRLVNDLTVALHLRGAFMLRRAEGDRYVIWNRAEGRDRVPDETALDALQLYRALSEPPTSLLLVHAKPLTAGRQESVPERYLALDALRVALIIPLITRSGLEAVLCLQPKLAHEAFDADDLELLAPVMRQTSAALDNALLFERLGEKVDELRQAYMRIAREQEAERARLARELHDGTAQELAGLITLATVAERQMDGSAGSARSTLERLRRQAEDAYQGVRRASHALRPLMLDDFGLVPTLSRYLQNFRESTSIKVEYDAEELGELSDDVELALFRVAQECMENVRKHSGALEARVSLARVNGHVTMTVSDAGRGMTRTGERGIGLAGMRERVEAVGGSIRVDSTPNVGVQVLAEIPVGVGA